MATAFPLEPPNQDSASVSKSDKLLGDMLLTVFVAVGSHAKFGVGMARFGDPTRLTAVKGFGGGGPALEACPAGGI